MRLGISAVFNTTKARRASGLRRGVSSKIFVGTVLVLLIAVLSEGIYFYSFLNNQSGDLTTVVSQLISPTTITTTQATVTVTATNQGYKTGLFFNTTLIIIPKGIADNQSLNYVPSNVTVVVGVNNSVTWINQDNLSQHTVVTNVVPAGGTQVDLILGTNQTYTVKFTFPGVYHYYCMWHPAWMRGTITVLSG